jgi:hypothetical protein
MKQTLLAGISGVSRSQRLVPNVAKAKQRLAANGGTAWAAPWRSRSCRRGATGGAMRGKPLRPDRGRRMRRLASNLGFARGRG